MVWVGLGWGSRVVSVFLNFYILHLNFVLVIGPNLIALLVNMRLITP